ncbi:MAG: hypothetical protein HN384_03830 [Nitrosopumilus sp.]|nr:hypothetical protein [Nitrosopumilus sp.]
MNKFYQKDIYTIQQFQYKKEPKYKWSVNFFKKLEIDEWDSFCEECITVYSKKLDNAWNNQKTNI